MNLKNEIIIPKEFFRLSDATYYYINGKRIDKPIPLYNGIFNKVWTNTGGTTLALKDNKPTIICSPRKQLLESKFLQQDTLIANGLLINEMCLVYGKDLVLEDDTLYKRQLVNDIKRYVKSVSVPKILCTYDSFSTKVVKALKDDIANYHIVVDEFQLLLMDSGFKSAILQRFINSIKDLDNVTFLSATPITNEIPKILGKEIPYYKCTYKADIYKKVQIKRIYNSRPIKAAAMILKEYRDNGFITATYNGDTIKSTEVVCFINSVNDICNLIDLLKLKSEDCNIICADGKDNETKLRKLGAKFKIGRVPTDKTKNKKFTFCTSTSFCGVDFYSDDAATLIISDGYKDNTDLDVSLEIGQIVGRQRLDTNVWRNLPILVYSKNCPLSEDKIAEKESSIQSKELITPKLIERYNNETDKDIKDTFIKDRCKIQNTIGNTNDYMIYDYQENKFIFNNMYRIFEYYNLQTIKENSRNVSIVDKINKTDTLSTNKYDKYQIDIDDELLNGTMLFSGNNFEDNMKLLCENSGNIFFSIDDRAKYQHYIDLLGIDRIKALSYKESNLKREIERISAEKNTYTVVKYELSKYLHRSETVPIKSVKLALQQIYDNNGIDKVATAKQITNYGFNVKEVVPKIEGKSVRCYLIL